jgi:hypothetical protein
MKRNRSHLSKDELGLLLSVCEQRAQEECNQLRKRLALLSEMIDRSEWSVIFCDTGDCDAATVYNVAAQPHTRNCETMMECDGFCLCLRKWCERHAEGKLYRLTTTCESHRQDLESRDYWCEPCMRRILEELKKDEGCKCKFAPYVPPK